VVRIQLKIPKTGERFLGLKVVNLTEKKIFLNRLQHLKEHHETGGG